MNDADFPGKLNARLVPMTGSLSALRLFIPDTVAIRNEFIRQLALDVRTRFPYWARLWPSSIALAQYIVAHPREFSGKTVLEIAGGLGLPSLAASFFAEQVVFSDIDPVAVALFSKVAALNERLNVQAHVMDWHALPANFDSDILLLSDVNYEEQSFAALHALINRFVDRGGSVLLSTPMRLVGRSFMEPLLPLVTQREVQAIEFEGEQTMITVLALAVQFPTTP